MTEKKPKKEKVQIETRAPQRRGIFDNLGKDRQKVKHPFGEIMNFPAENEVEPEDTQPIIPNQHNQHNQSYSTNPTNPVSPQSDYTKVANSIAREAVPERFFKGMSKNTYDALYLKTRGAVNPIRKIRATKSDLIRWTGVSDVTIDKHLKHLKSVGLLKVDFVVGSHDGNWYEVFIPEEADSPNQTNLTNPPNLPKKVGWDPPNLVGGDWVGLTPVNIEENASLKTSLKTNTKNDDDARATFAGFIEKFQTAAEDVTGKKMTRRDGENLEKFAELLILELKIAARRTENISSVPAFLTEVLRRKLRDAPTAKNPKVKTDTLGKPGDESRYEIKPLDAGGRESALAQLREFAGDEFLQDFKKWYTEEDWSWLVKQLEK